MATTISCPRLKNTTALAHKRGLLGKKQRLTCEFEDTCDHVDCIKELNPNYRTIGIVQGLSDQGVSREDRFYRILKKHQGVMKERGLDS